MSETARPRVAAIDWMRGLVMLLMTVDHASEAFNAGRVFSDAAWFPQRELPLAQFLTRWVTHLCAPTFVFLAGTSLALSTDRRVERGETPLAIDLHIAQRGLFIALLDPLWMTLGFFGGWAHVLLQVLYAIGVSLMLMAVLRKLPSWALVGAGIVLLGLVDLGVGYAFDHPTGGKVVSPPIVVAALVSGGNLGRVIVAYPVLPWLSIMMLGWALGQRLGKGASPVRLLSIAGISGLAVFAVLRGLDGFGNAGLHRTDASLVQWLHVSKYPPSVTFVGLELGVMALLLAGFFALERRGRTFDALAVLGGNALFYYLLHVHLLSGASHVLGMHRKLGLGAAWGGAALVAALLYFACRRYQGYKRGNDNVVTRWI